jgi:hypothetical protein
MYGKLETESGCGLYQVNPTIFFFFLKEKGKLGRSWGLSMLMLSSEFHISQTEIWRVCATVTCLWAV